MKFINKEEIILWLNKMDIRNYTINDDLTVDVDYDVYISFRRLKKIPIQFNKVSNSFHCPFNQLTTLKGAPKSVGGDFNCNNNQLTTLEGAPKNVGGDFYCSNNQLTTLDGAPRNVGDYFYCSGNPLDSLKGKPNYVKGGFCIDLVIYNKMFIKDKEWSLDDTDEIPVGEINIRDEIYK